MDTPENKSEGKGCCTSTSKCCGCKAVAAVVLLLVGGIIGFFCGRRCGMKMCPVSGMSVPAQTTK